MKEQVVQQQFGLAGLVTRKKIPDTQQSTPKDIRISPGSYCAPSETPGAMKFGGERLSLHGAF